MKRTLDMWKGKLQAELREEMAKGVSLETLGTTQKLMDNWLTAWDIWGKLDSVGDTMEPENGKPMRLTKEQMQTWNDNMLNADGSKGGHWSVEQTESVAGSVGVYFKYVTPAEWNVAMNMMYSDYSNVATELNVNTPTFYGKMAKAFLLDRDGGEAGEKLARYYCWVVKPNQ